MTGVIGGIITSFISGSQLSVSGPAAGLTTIVSASILAWGDYRIFILSVVIAGLVQVIMGLLRFGGVAYYFPSSVIKGMLAAIRSKQIPLHWDKINRIFEEWISHCLQMWPFSVNSQISTITFDEVVVITLFSLEFYHGKIPFIKKKQKSFPTPTCRSCRNSAE
jgi:hypothetical protein